VKAPNYFRGVVIIAIVALTLLFSPFILLAGSCALLGQCP